MTDYRVAPATRAFDRGAPLVRMRKSDIVFFSTGASALVCETVWARLLARVLGSDAGAGAIVLATFMGGMGLGALAFARLAHRSSHPVRWFASFELFIGVWAASSPSLLEALRPVDGFAWRAAVSAIVLLPPTLAMGASFPLMGRIAIRSDEEAGRATSAFYAANTFGGALGCLAAPCVLMPAFGLSGALRAAAVIELVAALLALAWLAPRSARSADAQPDDSSSRASHANKDRSATSATVAPAAARAATSSSTLARTATSPSMPARTPTNSSTSSRAATIASEPMLWIALAFGAASLALEVLLLRLLVTVTGASVYAFALVVGVFLVGIALGSRELSRVRDFFAARRANASSPGGAHAAVVFHAALAAPILTLIGLAALRFQLGESDLFASLANRVPEGASLPRLWASHVFLCAVALVPPALAFGVALPACAATLIERHAGASRERWLGLVYGFNTCGALCGSLTAAFVLLPRFGERVSIACVLAVLFAAALCVPEKRVRTLFVALTLSALLGAFVLAPREADGPRTIVVHAFDAHESVAVEDTRASDGSSVRSLRINGKPEASTAPVDQRLQLLLGHIPGLLHGRVKRALVIGLGTGMTSGSLLDLPSLEELTIFEISPAVRRAAQAFAPWNGRVLDDPRTSVVIADGRHALATSAERFDLITSDPVHPWTRGSSDLYTLEHFESMAAHLAPGGVASQWLPLYELSTDDVKIVVATWCAAFPHVSVWLTAYDLALVGSHEELSGERSLATLALPPKVERSLSRVGLASALEVAALEVGDDAALRELGRGIAPMRDDRPVLEFHAPLSFLAGYSTEILRWASRDAWTEHITPLARPRAAENRALLAKFLERLPSGWGPAAEQYGRELLALSH
jgi:spermidine synthase